MGTDSANIPNALSVFWGFNPYRRCEAYSYIMVQLKVDYQPKNKS